MNAAITEKFFGLLRYILGEQNNAPLISFDEWDSLFTLSVEQSLAGVVVDGLQRLSGKLKVPEDTILEWILLSWQIAEANRVTDASAVQLSRQLTEQGYSCCLLKGQGNALLYPQPSARMSGDIDLWVKGPLRRIISMARESMPEVQPMYHHVEFAPMNGIEVELHYRPSFMYNPIHNRRLQRWFRQVAPEQFSHVVALPGDAGSVSVPTDGFNRIFQLAHIANHVTHEGIGLRQLLDYYYLLKQGFTDDERRHDEQLLRHFGLYPVARAVMYVLQECFGMKQELLLVPPDEWRGRFLLKEILLAGNFGQYDQRLAGKHGRLSKNVQRLWRDLRFVRYFPSECLWEPVFRWYHFFWRLCH